MENSKKSNKNYILFVIQIKNSFESSEINLILHKFLNEIYFVVILQKLIKFKYEFFQRFNIQFVFKQIFEFQLDIIEFPFKIMFF